MADNSNFNIESKSISKSVKTNSDNILSICALTDGRIATSTFCEVVIYNLEKDKVLISNKLSRIYIFIYIVYTINYSYFRILSRNIINNC